MRPLNTFRAARPTHCKAAEQLWCWPGGRIPQEGVHVLVCSARDYGANRTGGQESLQEALDVAW